MPTEPSERELRESVLPEDVEAEARRAFLRDTYPIVCDAMAAAHAMGLAHGAKAGSEDIGDSITAALQDAKPRDAVERMLLSEIHLAHARVVRLTLLANEQKTPEAIATLNNYADKASNTVRRLALGLKEYRSTPSPPVHQTIHQANIADQQVVLNPQQSENVTNEQGCEHEHARPAKSKEALPPQSRRTRVASPVGDEEQTVEARHRPDNSRGKAPVKPKRA